MEQGSNAWYYLFPAVLSLITLVGYKKKSTGVIMLLILLFFSMFRGDHVGNDTLNYMNTERIRYIGGSVEFEVSGDYIGDNFGSRTEFLQILLNRLVYHLDLPPRIIIFTYSILTLLILYASLKRFNVNASIGLLVYVLTGLYYFSFNFARQMTAVSIVLWAMSDIVKPSSGLTTKGLELKTCFKKYKSILKFIGYIIVAAMIHASAIFYIFLYPLKNLKINRQFIAWCMVSVTLCCVLLSFNIMNVVYKMIDLEYVARYMGLYDEGGRSLMGRIFDVLRFTFLIYIFIFCSNRKYTNTYDVLYSSALILMALFLQTNGLLARITYYITVFICVYVPYSIVKEDKIYYGGKFSLFMIYILISIYAIGKLGTRSLTSGYYLMF